MRNSFEFISVGLVCCAALSGCGKKTAAGAAGGFPPVQVVVIEAKRQPVAETLSQVGSLVANEMVEIKSETDGVVQEILFQEGQHVEKGHLLVRLDESKFTAVVAEAEASFKLSQANYERSQQLFKDKLISQQDFDQAAAVYQVNQASLELKRRELKDSRIYASFAGLVGARNISPGQVITKNSTLTWLVDLSPVKVEFNVPERFLSQLRIGQTLEFNVAAFVGKKFKGEVYFIAPQVNPNDRTTLVKALIPNPDYQLKPGMFASLDLTLVTRENAVVIPEVAIGQLLEGNQALVFIVDESQTVQPRKVSLGVRLAGRMEVLAGLQGGEKIIVEGLQKVGPGSKVTLAPASAAAPYLAK